MRRVVGINQATKKKTTINYSGAKEDNIESVAWYEENSISSTHPVGGKMPNELGIYDMSGNVWEWCQDLYDEDYYSHSPLCNPTGPLSGSNRVVRGGSWCSNAVDCRVFLRYRVNPDIRCSNDGFRLCLSSPKIIEKE